MGAGVSIDGGGLARIRELQGLETSKAVAVVEAAGVDGPSGNFPVC